jgi:hypothetical protein
LDFGPTLLLIFGFFALGCCIIPLSCLFGFTVPGLFFSFGLLSTGWPRRSSYGLTVCSSGSFVLRQQWWSSTVFARALVSLGLCGHLSCLVLARFGDTIGAFVVLSLLRLV